MPKTYDRNDNRGLGQPVTDGRAGPLLAPASEFLLPLPHIEAFGRANGGARRGGLRCNEAFRWTEILRPMAAPVRNGQ